MNNELYLRNQTLLLKYDDCATRLGFKKREIRRNSYTGKELEKFQNEVHEILEELNENDIFEIEEYYLDIIAGDKANYVFVRESLYHMLDNIREKLRHYKNELGTIDTLNIRNKTCGRFTIHGDKYYYDAKEIKGLLGQSERLFNAFIEDADKKLSTDEIEEFDGTFNVASRRINRLNDRLRSVSGNRNLVVSANKGAYRGYKLIID